MYSPAQCERCGDSTVRATTATRAFCAPCASIASTGARSSSELLFTLVSPARRERTTAEDLASLAQPSAERASITPLLAFKSVASLTPPRPRRRIAAPLFAALAVLLASSTVALAWHASQPDRSITPVVRAKAEEPQKAEPPPSAPHALAPLAPPLAPEEQPPALAPRPEALAPETLDPRPAARTPRATAPRVTAPAPTVEEDLLDDLFGPPRAPAAVSTAPRVPTRREVSLAMRALEDDVAMCGGESGSMVTTRVTFGSSGRVAHAEVVDASVPPAVRSCIARALRGAELPEFAQGTFTVAYPFRL